MYCVAVRKHIPFEFQPRSFISGNCYVDLHQLKLQVKVDIDVIRAFFTITFLVSFTFPKLFPVFFDGSVPGYSYIVISNVSVWVTVYKL